MPQTMKHATRLCLVLLASAGCKLTDELLEVETGTQVFADQLGSPAAADLLVNSVATDFDCAFGAYTLSNAFYGDEVADAQLTVGIVEIDARRIPVDGGVLATSLCPTLGIFRSLSVARGQADLTARRLTGWTDAQVASRQRKLATVYAYGGYAVNLLAESYCTITIDAGPELSALAAFGEAEARFTNAIAAAQVANDASLLRLAYLGRARARLNLAKRGAGVDAAKLAAAASDAQQVTQGFVFNARFDLTPDRRRNPMYTAINDQEALTIQSDFRNLTTQGVPDPRVKVIDTGHRGRDAVGTPIWIQQKYLASNAPIPIARYTEARLIIAEATGGATAVDIINTLRAATLPQLPAFPGGSAQAIQAQIVEERSRELFLESHHLGDKLRYNLPFRPAAGTPYKGGGSYEPGGCLALPGVEKDNNPNATISK